MNTDLHLFTCNHKAKREAKTFSDIVRGQRNDFNEFAGTLVVQNLLSTRLLVCSITMCGVSFKEEYPCEEKGAGQLESEIDDTRIGAWLALRAHPLDDGAEVGFHDFVHLGLLSFHSR